MPDIEGRLELVTRQPTEEVVTINDLKVLLETNLKPKHYIGLEVSGLLHIGSLILTGFKIRDFLKAGFKCIVFLADWHSYINNKFGGEWLKIKQAAKYYEEAFKFFCPGVEVILGSDLYHHNDEFWVDYVRFCKQITLARNARCLTIMGRTERDKLDFSQYLYPPLQAVDIRAIDLDLVHAGMDQRKVHMLVREVFPQLDWKTPVAVHHHLLPGLAEPVSLGLDEDMQSDKTISSKMSKSKPWTCIFVHDSKSEIEAKTKQAWCPIGVVESNPIIELAKYVVFHETKSLKIDRPARFGGSIVFEDYGDLEKAYLEKKVHPADLKSTIAKSIDEIVSPVREYFRRREDLLEVYRPGVSSKPEETKNW
jgi:tyrosyl-tRNA synthetase